MGYPVSFRFSVKSLGEGASPDFLSAVDFGALPFIFGLWIETFAFAEWSRGDMSE